MISRNILIVDDEVGIRELLSDILQDEGHRVITAESADCLLYTSPSPRD